MQFPTIPSQKITPPARTDVAAVAPATPVSAAQQRAVAEASQPAVPGQPVPDAPPGFERRQGSRRDAPDRRRIQVAVMLDTRTGRDRRGERRRADDPRPGRFNESA